MSVLLQISDTHFGTEQPQVLKALLALVEQLRPDLCVLSGDITQRARPAQFRAAKAFTNRLGAPVLVVPGNHDIPLFNLWARLTCPYAQFVRAFGSDLESEHSSPDLLVLGVNTTRAWRHKNGEVSSAQIDRVAKRLSVASPQQLRVVVAHPPAAVTNARDRPDLFRGHAAALRAWSVAGVDLVLGGHIHMPYTLALHGFARRLWVVQAGTAVSSRTRLGGANSVNVLRWGETSSASADETRGRGDAGPCCLIEQWDFALDNQAFVRTAVTAVQPERG